MKNKMKLNTKKKKMEVKQRVKNLDGTGLFGTEGGFGKGLFFNKDSFLEE